MFRIMMIRMMMTTTTATTTRTIVGAIMWAVRVPGRATSLIAITSELKTS